MLTDFDYVSPYWYNNDKNEKVEPETLPTIAENKSGDVNWSGWVFVPAGNKLTIDGSVTLTDNVNLILADGAELEITGGITSDSKTLTVYGQTSGTGKLTVSNSSGNGVTGNVTVLGGNVEISGAGDTSGISGNVEISGGNVTIRGIGGGSSNGIEGNVTVSGGDVEISSTGSMAGHGVTGNVTVNGGNVKISGAGEYNGWGVDGEDKTITVSGNGVLTLYGSKQATGAVKENVNATVQTSTDGTTWSDWTGSPALNTYKYLKLTALEPHRSYRAFSFSVRNMSQPVEACNVRSPLPLSAAPIEFQEKFDRRYIGCKTERASIHSTRRTTTPSFT